MFFNEGDGFYAYTAVLHLGGGVGVDNLACSGAENLEVVNRRAIDRARAEKRHVAF